MERKCRVQQPVAIIRSAYNDCLMLSWVHANELIIHRISLGGGGVRPSYLFPLHQLLTSTIWSKWMACQLGIRLWSFSFPVTAHRQSVIAPQPPGGLLVIGCSIDSNQFLWMKEMVNEWDLWWLVLLAHVAVKIYCSWIMQSTYCDVEMSFASYG